MDADWLKGSSQILWLGLSLHKEEKLTSIQSEWVVMCSSLRSCSGYRGVSLFSLCLWLSFRECEKHYQRQTHPQAVYTHVFPWTSKLYPLTDMFWFCSFVLYYEGASINSCELASCTFNARYLLRIVWFTMDQDGGLKSKVFFMELPLKSYAVWSSCCLCESKFMLHVWKNVLRFEAHHRVYKGPESSEVHF